MSLLFMPREEFAITIPTLSHYYENYLPTSIYTYRVFPLVRGRISKKGIDCFSSPKMFNADFDFNLQGPDVSIFFYTFHYIRSFDTRENRVEFTIPILMESAITMFNALPAFTPIPRNTNFCVSYIEEDSSSGKGGVLQEVYSATLDGFIQIPESKPLFSELDSIIQKIDQGKVPGLTFPRKLRYTKWSF